MSAEYKRNHYVPDWYQRRFLPSSTSRKLYYLDLDPPRFKDRQGVTHVSNSLRLRGPRSCFYEDDLYTLKLGSLSSKEIEQFFFGEIDDRGRTGVDHFARFRHDEPGHHQAFPNLIRYMSAQKLRTPKGLASLRDSTRSSDRNDVLRGMILLRDLFCATWTESVWLIADASASATKFIVSDHPVTVITVAADRDLNGAKNIRTRKFGLTELTQSSHCHWIRY